MGFLSEIPSFVERRGAGLVFSARRPRHSSMGWKECGQAVDGQSRMFAVVGRCITRADQDDALAASRGNKDRVFPVLSRLWAGAAGKGLCGWLEERGTRFSGR